MNEQQTANSENIKKQFQLPENSIPLIITFLTPGDKPDEFKVGIFINEQQPPQLLKNSIGAVNDIIEKRAPNIMGPGGTPNQPKKPTLKDLVED
jgi:hypothetical protein